jgi:hypothetical protein
LLALGPEYAQLVVRQGAAGTVAVHYPYRPYRLACDTGHFLCFRAAVVTAATVHLAYVIDDGSVVDDGHVAASVHIIVVDVPVGDVLAGHEGPVGAGHATKIHVNAYVHSRHQRGPSVVVIAIPPANPGRAPFFAGHPNPSIIVVMCPAAVVEWRPSPGIVRHPGPAIIGIYPVTVGIIGPEVLSCVRYPHLAIVLIVNPLAIGTQGIIKSRERYARLHLLRPCCYTATASDSKEEAGDQYTRIIGDLTFHNI